jgi:phosphocarrier protein
VFIKKKIKIKNPQGLHARPASIFVKIANKFESDISVKKDSDTVDGKSIMGLLVLGANRGSVVEVQISGPDAEQMMKEIEDFLLSDKEGA